MKSRRSAERPFEIFYEFEFVFDIETVFFRIDMLGWQRALWTSGSYCIFEIPESDPRAGESGTDTRLVAKDGEGRVRSIGIDAVRITVSEPLSAKDDINAAIQHARAAALSVTSKALAMFAVKAIPVLDKPAEGGPRDY